MIEFLMLNLQVAEVLLLAVCAYCLTSIVKSVDGSKMMDRSNKVSGKIVTVGGTAFGLWVIWCLVIASGYSAPS